MFGRTCSAVASYMGFDTCFGYSGVKVSFLVPWYPS
jgi:hypothetical protein